MSEELAAIRAWAASPPPDGHVDVTHLRAALAEVARLTAEVERLSAMVPRWVNVGTDRVAWRLRVAGQDVGLTQLELDTSGRWYEWPACVRYPDLPTACAAVCRRLGLTDIKPPTENT